MAGDYKGPGHRIVSGETPTVGMRVLNNNLEWCTITKVADPEGNKTCGWYCEAWHETDKGSFNCDRLSTRMPR